MQYKLLFLDTETTGNEPSKDRLTQISYKHDNTIVSEYFKPPLPISVKSMSVTHITNKMVIDKPVFIDSPMFIDLEKLLSDHILIAHNVFFDIAILKNEGLKTTHFIDTLRVARFLDAEAIIPEYDLQFLRYYLDIEIPDATAHDAKGDVLVLEALFNRLKIKMEKTQPDNDPIKAMLDISSKPSLLRRFTFGKYKGELVADIVQKDHGYLKWLYGQKIENDTEGQDDDWVYTLKYYLK